MESKSGKKGFFSDERADLNIEKKKFSEKSLCYVNQVYISTVKGGEIAIYNRNFILRQLFVAANQPDEVEEYLCK